MLRSNSKKAIENIKNYVIKNYNPDGYEDNSEEYNATTFKEMAACILKDVRRVKGYEVRKYKRYGWEEAFADWASGLPGLLDTCYYYNRSAVDDLGTILEESEAEKERFDESQAEKMLSHLIFRELNKAAGEVLR